MRKEELAALANPEKMPVPTEREVVQILWRSYELSQGSEPLQCHILERLATYYEQPVKSQLDAETIRDQFTKLLTDQTGSLRIGSSHRHMYIKKTDVESELEKRFDEMLDHLTTTPNLANLLSNQTFLEKIWVRDNAWMQQPQGRPNRTGIPDATLADSFYSTAINYFVFRKQTGNKHVDRFLNELYTTPLDSLSKKTLDAMSSVLTRYEETHPDTEISQTLKDQLATLLATKVTNGVTPDQD